MSTPDPASLQFLAESVLVRVDELRAHLPGLRGDDAEESIHQTRVACRRLRTAFALFDGALDEAQLAGWDRRVRRLGRALGQARDLDVQIGFLDDHLKSRVKHAGGRAGLDRMRLRLKQRRRAADRRLRRKVRKFVRSSVLDELDLTLRETAVRARLLPRGDGPRWLWIHSAARVAEHLEQLLMHEPFVEQPERVEELHQMRIAAKHLRYALEALSSLHEGRLAPPIAVARALQKRLGEIHDCDVWIAFLPEFIRSERKRTRRFFGHLRGFKRISAGLEALLAERIDARQAMHAGFVEFWHRECGDSLWRDLRELLVRDARTMARPGPSGFEGGAGSSAGDAPMLERL